MDKTITIGPFVGSFFEEIMNFRPFVQWVSENLIYNDIFVFSHHNRRFLYKENMIHIYEQYSVDYKTSFHKNNDISLELYNFIFKNLKKEVTKISDVKLKDVISLFNKYPKNRIKTSLLNKKFNEIDIPEIDIDLPDDFVIFIPYKHKNNNILRHLQNIYKNVIIIDNGNIYHKCLNKNFDMIERWYEYCIYIMSKSKMVICPLSNWTFLCNLQGVPVMSWGDNINVFKSGGLYNFNNINHIISNTSSKNIISGIEYFRKRL